VTGASVAMRVAAVAALSVLALSGAGAAHAASPAGTGDGGFQCKPDGLQQEMNACAVRDYRAADAQLNIRYLAVMNALPAQRRVGLRQEQREWLKRRDPQCKAEAKDSEGGSIWPLDFYGCLRKLTLDRTKAINGWEGRQ
jgi:uncharacterized protein YecT (DUF1311 family)